MALQPTVFGSEIVSPFRNTVCFINGNKRDIQGFRRKSTFSSLVSDSGATYSKLGKPVAQVSFYLYYFRFAQGGVQHMRNTVVSGKIANGIYLILHQGNQG
jgi:hypothetical protein